MYSLESGGEGLDMLVVPDEAFQNLSRPSSLSNLLTFPNVCLCGEATRITSFYRQTLMRHETFGFLTIRS